MRKFKIDINTDGRYNGIWDVDILPDYHEMDGENLSPEDIVEDVAESWWNNMDSDEYEALAKEGIESYRDMISSYAWSVSEVVTDEDGRTEFVKVGEF